MADWLRIEGGIVTNVEVHDAEPAPVAGVTWLQAGGGIGWTYDGQTLKPPTAPAPAVPLTVHRYQARGALYARDNGVLLAQVDALVAQQGGITNIWWTAAPDFQRADARFNALGAMLTPPLAPADIDALFVAASKL